jgi:hypothetical protein
LVPVETATQPDRYRSLLYLGLFFDKQDILDVVYAADYMDFNELKSIVGETIMKNIDTDTALQLYVFGHGNDLLKEHDVVGSCLKYIESDSNTRNILKSEEFLELPEEHLIALISRDTFVAPEAEILRAVCRWREHNEKDMEEMEDVAECIRLSRFRVEEIFTVVEPTGLFSEKLMLDGVRALTMTDLSISRPRGRCLAQTDLLQHFEEPRDIGSSFDIKYTNRNGSGGTVTKDLQKSYLVNYLCFEVNPGLSNPEKLKWYSYEVSVSLDGNSWLTLFNYHEDDFHCRGRQVLLFPTIPVRIVRVWIRSIEGIEKCATYNPYTCRKPRGPEEEKVVEFTSHEITSLQYRPSERIIPFKFLEKGVIAPLRDHEVEFMSLSKKEDGGRSVEAFFNQPYSASSLR